MKFFDPENENYNGKRAADKPRVRSRNGQTRYIDEKFEVQIIKIVESYGKRRVQVILIFNIKIFFTNIT